MNRVQAAIDRYEERIRGFGGEERGVGKDGTPLRELRAKQALTMQEFVHYQNTQAVAFHSGRLSYEEAQTLYSALGGESYAGTPDGWPAGTSLATIMTVTQVVGELMGVGIASRR